MNSYPYDAVVFDLDGTLFDAEDGILSSATFALETLGLPVPAYAEMREMIGPPLKESMASILRVPEALIPEASAILRKHLGTKGIYQYSVYKHIRTLLEMLSKNHVHIGMATSKMRYMAVDILTHFGLIHYFDAIEGELDIDQHMGKAKLIQRALPEKYKRACMVGDRRFDMEGAQAVGIDGIGAGYGCGTEEELRHAGATHIVPDTESLRALLCAGGDVPRGFFLSVEGPDGSGKTTQVGLLKASLEKYGFDVLHTREPGGCTISEDIRDIILDTDNMEMTSACEALLYAASRAQHVSQVIAPALEEGKLVLCDRFVDSSIAYQGGGRELGIETVQAINAPAVGNTMPDASLYLAIDHKVALSRRLSATTPDRLEMEDLGFHKRVQKAYERLIRENRKRFLVVDATQSVESVAKDALAVVLGRIDPQIESNKEG